MKIRIGVKETTLSGKRIQTYMKKNDEIGNFRWKIVGVTLLSNDWRIEHAKWG